MSAYLDDPPLAFAHRGGAAEGDENTAEAFARAVALGYRYVETDVHATSDGVPVVFHDTTLARVAGRPERIEDLSWAELTTVWPAVPRLDDVLAGWPDIRFNIDVKAASAIEPTVEAVTRVSAGDRVLLASFSDARLARLRLLAGPKVATSLGMRSVARLKAASVGGWRITMPPSAVAAQVPVRYGRVRLVDRRFIGYAHRLGLQVHVWTIDDPAEMHYLLDLGVDGIMTDRVDVLRDVYMSRGVWPTEGNP